MNLQQNDNNANNEQGLKRVLIKFVGGKREPEEVFIGPGTTTSDLLRELKCEPNKWSASKGGVDSTFAIDEALYPQLEDGDLVYVSSQVNAGD